MAKFIAYVSVGFVGCDREKEFEVPDDELEGLSDLERENLLGEYARDTIFNYVEWGWKPAEGA